MAPLQTKLATLYKSQGPRGLGATALRRFRKSLTATITARKGVTQTIHDVSRQITPARVSDADPYKILYVDPGEITHVTGEISQTQPGNYHLEHCNSFSYLTSGFSPVIPGEWDQSTGQFADLSESVAAKEVINNDRLWQETELFRQHRRRLEAGYRSYGCYSVEELAKRATQLSKLVSSLRNQGYRESSAVNDHPLHEVRVNIGRDGNFYYNSEGRHRLAIAKALQIDVIPVVVMARHPVWQEKRDAIRNHGMSYSEFGSLRDHRDLIELLPSDEHGHPS